MNEIKCECGHVNPEGTVLCEACGKPIQENQHIDGNDKQKLLNMRYEGSARRSKTYNKSIVDKIWNFFSSVKVAVWLIVIALVASGIGTIFPQEQYIPADAPSQDPSIFYEAEYGILGKAFYQLGFHSLYSSWWYMLLIAAIGVSLVICSIDRFVPLHKALKAQRPKRHKQFLRRQRLFSETDHVTDEEKGQLISRLKKRRYKVREQNGHILAEKGRFSRWGPYVNHIGLIIILIAALLRMSSIMYLDEYVWVREGEQTAIPGTDSEYYVENKEFILETYDEDDERFQDAIAQEGEPVEKSFKTNAVIYKKADNDVAGDKAELEKVTEDQIRMNHPLKFDKYTLYQAGYQENEFQNLTFNVHKTDNSDETLGTFTIDLTDPEETFQLDNGFDVTISEYYPDYEMEDGEPTSETNYPRNPAFVFKVDPPGDEEEEISFVGIGRNVDATGQNDYELGIEDFETRFASGLSVKVDHTLPFFIIGAIIFMIGVSQGMYWHHRRIWLRPEGDGLMIAGHTNKNWFGLKKDIEAAVEDTNVKMVEDQQEIE